MTFIYNEANRFVMWDHIHLATVFLLALILLCFYLFRKQLLPYQNTLRVAIGITLLLSRLSLDTWYIITKNWDMRHSLPLELCSIASLACAVMLLTKNKSLFEMCYFIGIAGAIQAILTPELMFGFPQYRFLQFFLDHLLLLLGPLLMIWLFDFTITKFSLVKAFIMLNIIAAIVFVINLITDSNYMFLRNKPTSTSLLDILGPYPIYLFALEGIALFIFILLWLPFKKRKTPNIRQDS